MFKPYLSITIILIFFLSCAPQKEDIYQAVKNDNMRWVETIIAHYPEAIIEVDNNGYLPLDYAILCHSSLEMINYLVKQQYEKGQDFYFYLPIERALEESSYDVAAVILDNAFDINHEEGNLLNSIIDSDTDPKNVDFLLNNGLEVVPVTEPIAEAFFKAIKYGHTEIINMLIKAGINPNSLYGNITPIFEATRLDNLEIMKSLLDAGANPDGDTNSSSRPISRTTSLAALKLLLENGANINLAKDGYSPLLVMVSNTSNVLPEDEMHDRMYEVIEEALENGANPNIRTVKGETPLSFALQNSSQEIIDLLRSYGARP